MTPLASYTADHRRLLEAAARVAELLDPVAFTPSTYAYYLLKSAIRGSLLPLEGVLFRDWMTSGRHYYPGTQFGVRLYSVAISACALCRDHGYRLQG